MNILFKGKVILPVEYDGDVELADYIKDLVELHRALTSLDKQE